MKLAILLALATIAGATSSDSLALARFRADSTLAVGLMREAAHMDSTAYQRRVQAQTIYEMAVQHLAQDTARKVP